MSLPRQQVIRSTYPELLDWWAAFAPVRQIRAKLKLVSVPLLNQVLGTLRAFCARPMPCARQFHRTFCADTCWPITTQNGVPTQESSRGMRAAVMDSV
jgi:hypothetical protein